MKLFTEFVNNILIQVKISSSVNLFYYNEIIKSPTHRFSQYLPYTILWHSPVSKSERA